MSEPAEQKFEPPAAPINKPYVVRAEDGTVYAGADELANAVVLAGALFVSSVALGYRPSLSVEEQTTGTVMAIIGKPEEQT
jgi:hypothetical protein